MANGTSAQLSNASTEVNKISTNDNHNNDTNAINDLTMAITTDDEAKIAAELNDTNSDDDVGDDMILRQDQIDALYSLNAAKRNGLKNVFHHWPQGVVPIVIDPIFYKGKVSLEGLLSIYLFFIIIIRR
jgi:hypothetical protein